MKRVVLTFGLVSGVVLSAMMLLTFPFHEQMGWDAAEVVGYATMVAASIFIVAGIRRYRDTVGGGTVTFGRALGVGLLIVTVSSACYTATWEAYYFTARPDFMGRYTAHTLGEMRERGASESAIAAKQAEMAKFATLYENPVINAAMTFVEPLPVGVLVSLMAAFALSRRRSAPGVGEARVSPV